MVALACSLRCWQNDKIQSLSPRLSGRLLSGYLCTKAFAYQSLDPVSANGFGTGFFGYRHAKTMARNSIGPRQYAETVVGGTIWLLKNLLEFCGFQQSGLPGKLLL